MRGKRLLRGVKKRLGLLKFRIQNRSKEAYLCPICNYHGPFRNIHPPTGLRRHALCPNCGARERHRLQFLVVQSILKDLDTSKMRMLHFAPEPFFRDYFSNRFYIYETADLEMQGVDYIVDIQQLPFADSAYDFVFASHVLEHIPDDRKAIKEIRRILKQNGIAVLPVPIVSEYTIEYPAPNPNESDHVRAPGYDYYSRFKSDFSRIEKYTSQDWPERYQLYIFKETSDRPTDMFSLRKPISGERHIDIVPVCYA